MFISLNINSYYLHVVVYIGYHCLEHVLLLFRIIEDYNSLKYLFCSCLEYRCLELISDD